MELRFEQVLEYLESGVKDPQFEQFVNKHPDGPRMLEEAKLLRALLLREAQVEPDDDFQVLGNLSREDSAPEYAMANSHHKRMDESDDMADDDYKDMSPQAVAAASRLAQRAAGRLRIIGALAITVRETEALLSFEPDFYGARMRRSQTDLPPQSKDSSEDIAWLAKSAGIFDSVAGSMQSSEDRRRESDLRIRGSGIEIVAPARLAKPRAIRLNVRDTQLRTPMRGLELIFIPEEGPFTKSVTNSDGVAELPVPEQPGMLRIETRSPQLIRVRLNLLP